MKVREMMTTDVASATPDTTLEEIATMMRDEDTGAIPVLDEGELVGIVTDRDIVIRCIAEGRNPSEVTAEDVMSTDLETIDADADVEEASRLMAEKQVRRLPVVENGRFSGMLSLGDLAVKEQERPKDKAGRALKEISQGVKNERKAAQPAAPTAGKKAAGGTRRASQGMGNRSAMEEEKRQSRVIPFREQGRRTPRRKTG